MMKKSFLIILFSVVICGSNAQSSEMGIMVGVSTYKGDLNEHLLNTKDIHLAFGALYRRSFNNHWSFKAAINATKLTASDSTSGDPYQEHRNLSFRSKIIELNLQFEFNFFKFQTANPATKWSPFLLVGLNVFHFNPEGNLNGTWYKLQPLGTEGQGTSNRGKKYNRTVVALDYGGGFKFRLSRRLGFVIECGIRKTYTDYLDDVSKTYAKKSDILATNGVNAALLSDRSVDQLNDNNLNRDRGNKNNRDYFMITGVQINYTLSKKYNDVCKPFRTKFR